MSAASGRGAGDEGLSTILAMGEPCALGGDHRRFHHHEAQQALRPERKPDGTAFAGKSSVALRARLSWALSEPNGEVMKDGPEGTTIHFLPRSDPLWQRKI